MAKNIYHRDGCLFILGCILLLPAVISFLIAAASNSFDYKISDTSRKNGDTRYIQSDLSLDEVKKEHPGKQVTELEKKFPLKSTVFLLICVSLIVYSRLVKRKEKKIIKLWDLLEKNKSLPLQTLREKFGYDKEFVLDALHYINQTPNASFTYHADSDLIYDDTDTVEWQLAVKCSNCGGYVNEKVFIRLHNESFSCPYCASSLTDDKFEEHKKKYAKQPAKQNEARLDNFPDVGVEQGEVAQTSMQNPDKAGVSWRPLKGGGTNFTTKRLKKVNVNRVEFKSTLGYLLFTSTFAALGLWIVSLAFSEIPNDVTGIFMTFLVGGPFAGLGVWMLWGALRPVVFDQFTGYFWKGWKSPREATDPTAIKECVALDDILALQMVKEYCSTSSGSRGSKSYHSYELNLVLKDRSRINIFDHGSYKHAIKDAETLAEFLDVPVWNDRF